MRIDRRFLLLLTFIIGVFASAAHGVVFVTPSTTVHNHSSANAGGGTLALSGALSSTKPCETGYTRFDPNLCWITAGVGAGFTLLTRDVCTSVTLPSGARGAYVRAIVQANAANVVATRRDTDLSAWSTSGCNVIRFSRIAVTAREQVATGLGSVLGGTENILFVPGAPFWFLLTDDAGNQGTGGYELIGYID